MKKVLIISTSLRTNSNSELLAKSFMDGVISSGNEVEFISLKNKKIAFCLGCMACQKTKQCVIKDDSNEIVDKMSNADVIVWATPTYYYSMSGQMKTLIDRANSLFVRDNKFKEIYLLVTAAENEEYTPKHVIGGVQGWIDCFNDVKLVGTLFVGEVDNDNSIKGHDGLKKAYELGANV